jgi:hypothetical protein
MEEWDPANNDCIEMIAVGEQITRISKSSVPHGKNIIVNTV